MSAPLLPVFVKLNGRQTSSCPVRSDRTVPLFGPTTVDAPPPDNPCLKNCSRHTGLARREPFRRRSARILRLRGNVPLPQQVKATVVGPNHNSLILPQSKRDANLWRKESPERTTADRRRALDSWYPSRITSVNHEQVVNLLFPSRGETKRMRDPSAPATRRWAGPATSLFRRSGPQGKPWIRPSSGKTTLSPAHRTWLHESAAPWSVPRRPRPAIRPPRRPFPQGSSENSPSSVRRITVRL